MASPLLQEAAASAHPAHSAQSCASNLLGFAISFPLILVSPGLLWSRAEAKNTSSLSNFIFRCSPEGAMSELLVFA